MYIKFQKILMTGCRDMDKKHQKYPQNGGFPPFVTPQDFFFKNRVLSLLYPCGAPTSCKISKKTNERPHRYLKTDRQTDGQADKGDYYGPHRVNPGSKNYRQIIIYLCIWTTRVAPTFLGIVEQRTKSIKVAQSKTRLCKAK